MGTNTNTGGYYGSAEAIREAREKARRNLVMSSKPCFDDEVVCNLVGDFLCDALGVWDDLRRSEMSRLRVETLCEMLALLLASVDSQDLRKVDEALAECVKSLEQEDWDRLMEGYDEDEED